jgi:hypothetical protein
VLTRAPWRRWAILSPGPLLWAVWFVTHRDANEISTDVGEIVSYSARMFLGATTSLAAGWEPGGVVLAVAFVVFVGLAGWRWRSLDGRSLGALAAPVAFIVFTAVTRIDIVPRIAPDELRYSWTIAAYLVLAVVVLVRPEPLFATVVVPRGAWAAAGAAAALVVVLGAVQLVPDLTAWNDKVRDARPGLSSLVFATEAVGAERIDGERVIPLSFVPVTAGAYLDAVASVGSPIAGFGADGLGGDDYQRGFADELLVSQLPVELRERPSQGVDCEAPEGASGASELTVAPGTTVLLRAEIARAEAGGEVTVQRLGPPGEPQRLMLSLGTAWLVVPADAPNSSDVSLPYRVSLPSGLWSVVCP